MSTIVTTRFSCFKFIPLFVAAKFLIFLEAEAVLNNTHSVVYTMLFCCITILAMFG